MSDRVRLQARVTPWQPLAATALTTLVLLASFGSSDAGATTWRLRFAGVAVAATTGFVFDDPAAATLAPSPTPLLVRRWHRFAWLVACVVAWWAAATLLLRARFDVTVPGGLGVELATTTAVGVGAALAVARASGSHAPGMTAAIVAPAWFTLSYVPHPEWLVIPPAPGADAAMFLGVTVVGVAFATVASLDPCIRPIAPPLRRRRARLGVSRSRRR